MLMHWSYFFCTNPSIWTSIMALQKSKRLRVFSTHPILDKCHNVMSLQFGQWLQVLFGEFLARGTMTCQWWEQAGPAGKNEAKIYSLYRLNRWVKYYRLPFIPGGLGQNHCCWCPGFLCHQGPLLLTWFNFNPSMDIENLARSSCVGR